MNLKASFVERLFYALCELEKTHREIHKVEAKEVILKVTLRTKSADRIARDFQAYLCYMNKRYTLNYEKMQDINEEFSDYSFVLLLGGSEYGQQFRLKSAIR
jgi:hypothetical protein